MASVIRTVLTIIFAIDSIVLIVVVLMQQGKDRGLGAISGMNTSDTYWGKNKGRSKEGKLVMITRICAVIFILLALVLNMSF